MRQMDCQASENGLDPANHGSLDSRADSPKPLRRPSVPARAGRCGKLTMENISMKRSLCLITVVALSFTTMACNQVRARSTIQDANRLYMEGNYGESLELYKRAQQLENFAELDRMIGYSHLGLFKTSDPSTEEHARHAAAYLNRYLEDNDDPAAEEVLINLLLNSEQTDLAIQRLERSLEDDPDDVLVMKSIANLLATKGEARPALVWYQRVIDAEPTKENYYTMGVILYEMVSKGLTSSREEALAFIERGKASLGEALERDPEYFDALVFTNLLYREEAVLTDDFDEKTALINQADEYRQRAIAIARKRAAEAEAAAETTPSE